MKFRFSDCPLGGCLFGASRFAGGGEGGAWPNRVQRNASAGTGVDGPGGALPREFSTPARSFWNASRCCKMHTFSSHRKPRPIFYSGAIVEQNATLPALQKTFVDFAFETVWGSKHEQSSINSGNLE